MKRLAAILFVVAALMSCSKQEIKLPAAKSGFIVTVKLNDKLSTGEVVEKEAKSIITAWKADGKDFDLTREEDFKKGYAYDKFTQASIKYDYGSLNSMAQETAPGRYLVLVQLEDMENEPRRFAFSYTYITVNTGQFESVKKAFTTKAKFDQFEVWNEPE